MDMKAEGHIAPDPVLVDDGTAAQQSVHPVILCGGSGTRLWPLSREQHPKQLLAMTEDATLLQSTVMRMEPMVGSNARWAKPIIVCNKEHRFAVAEQLREIGSPPGAVMLEPVGRNTAPALTLAALLVAEKAGEREPVLLVVPADHIVKDTEAFQRSMEQARKFAESDHLVAFGVTPTWAESGYGYIRQGETVADEASGSVRYIDEFIEKPDNALAKQFVDSGRYLWNSGMFMMRASVWLELAEQLCPETFARCRVAFQEGRLDHGFYSVGDEHFSACPSESIDYAVMERIRRGHLADTGYRAVTIELEGGWSDVGSWDALWSLGEKDSDGNVVKGDVHCRDTRNSLVLANGRLVACVGMEDVVVIETPDAVMVTRRDRAQDVKHVVDSLREAKRPEGKLHRKVARPWGTYDGIDSGERFQVKRIVVRPGATLSLQMHHHRAEHWIVVRGTARVVRGDETFILSENESTYIPLGTVHRLENPGRVPLELIEVQSGSYLGEDDIVRFDDAYGRSGQ